jgi:hypothetical protein
MDARSGFKTSSNIVNIKSIDLFVNAYRIINDMLHRKKWQPKSWATILQPFKIVFWLMRQSLFTISMKGKNCIWTLF